MFKGFEEAAKKREEEYMSHVSDAIKARVADPSPVTLSEFKELRMNSFEQELIYPKLDIEALIYATKHCLSNCSRHSSRRPCSTYDDALIIIWVPLLLERLSAAEARIQKINRSAS